MSTFIAGQIIKAETQDGSSSVVGTLEDPGTGALEIRIMGVAYTFTDSTGTLKPRWQAAVITVLSPPRPPMPTLPYALVEAGHKDVVRSMWIRLPAGVWRNVGSRLTADWFEMLDPEVIFPGVER